MKQFLFINKILQESRQLILRSDFNSFQVSQLLHLDGVSRNKIYDFFGNKVELLTMLLEISWEPLNMCVINLSEKERTIARSISDVMICRNNFIKHEPLLLKYTSEQKYFKKILGDMKKNVQSFEDRLLAHASAKACGTSINAVTEIGLTHGQIWELLFPMDTRNDMLYLLDQNTLENHLNTII